MLKTAAKLRTAVLWFLLVAGGFTLWLRPLRAHAGLPATTHEPPRRLVAWQRVELAPGEAKSVMLDDNDCWLGTLKPPH